MYTYASVCCDDNRAAVTLAYDKDEGSIGTVGALKKVDGKSPVKFAFVMISECILVRKVCPCCRTVQATVIDLFVARHCQNTADVLLQ